MQEVFESDENSIFETGGNVPQRLAVRLERGGWWWVERSWCFLLGSNGHSIFIIINNYYKLVYSVSRV